MTEKSIEARRKLISQNMEYLTRLRFCSMIVDLNTAANMSLISYESPFLLVKSLSLAIMSWLSLGHPPYSTNPDTQHFGDTSDCSPPMCFSWQEPQASQYDYGR